MIGSMIVGFLIGLIASAISVSYTHLLPRASLGSYVGKG